MYVKVAAFSWVVVQKCFNQDGAKLPMVNVCVIGNTIHTNNRNIYWNKNKGNDEHQAIVPYYSLFCFFLNFTYSCQYLMMLSVSYSFLHDDTYYFVSYETKGRSNGNDTIISLDNKVHKLLLCIRLIIQWKNALLLKAI